MDKQAISDFWFSSAERNRQDALGMIGHHHFDWGLFVWHLAIEKILKGLLAKQDLEIPKIHNLAKLADMANLNLMPEQRRQLQEITTFNLEARYPEYKSNFYQKADQSYATLWSHNCEELFQWLIKQR